MSGALFSSADMNVAAEALVTGDTLLGLGDDGGEHEVGRLQGRWRRISPTRWLMSSGFFCSVDNEDGRQHWLLWLLMSPEYYSRVGNFGVEPSRSSILDNIARR
jgi:hypothetical protein